MHQDGEGEFFGVFRQPGGVGREFQEWGCSGRRRHSGQGKNQICKAAECFGFLLKFSFGESVPGAETVGCRMLRKVISEKITARTEPRPPGLRSFAHEGLWMLVRAFLA